MILLKRCADRLLVRKCLSQRIGQKCHLSDNRVRLAYYNITPVSGAANAQNQPPVLIFHGLFGSKNNWKSISKAIAAKTGRSVYAFDLRNHGNSPHTSGADTNLRTMADDINLFLEDNNYSTATLLGHSLGGRVVLQYGYLWPQRVEKLIAVDITPLRTAPNVFFFNTEFCDKMKKAVEGLSSDINLPEARKLVNENLKSFVPDEFIRGFFLMSLDKEDSGKVIWKFNLDAIKHMIGSGVIPDMKIKEPFSGKALLIHGEKSEWVKRTDYEAIRPLLPNVEFVEIADTGHYLHIERPNQFLDSVLAFLKSS